jgi:hypothetical protein
MVPEGLLGLEDAAHGRSGFCSGAACAGFFGLFHRDWDSDIALVFTIQLGDVAGYRVRLS